ncbi:MAG TPA: hypothetical protein VEG64_04470 [Candidatus Sulfotelmatobacter sp.]|nr:hypothetical protein [Candidatus Sulfotelmatobacter sp.]
MKGTAAGFRRGLLDRGDAACSRGGQAEIYLRDNGIRPPSYRV